jgi:hypothetical protein
MVRLFHLLMAGGGKNPVLDPNYASNPSPVLKWIQCIYGGTGGKEKEGKLKVDLTKL